MTSNWNPKNDYTLPVHVTDLLPQALLARHEAYMAEAEEGRRKMSANVNKLESDKKCLEDSNAKTIEENRYLLDQLEELNGTISSSDAQISALNSTLQSTCKELDRLTVLAARTSELEAQLLAVETEQAKLQTQLISSEEESRSAVQRWKGAERTIGVLAEQIDRIEKEAREERARHAEVVARFERQRAVERELENAAGRLKGAAAATSLHGKGSTSVVSHFVKDILQDNANLQMGIVELREMLMGSNQEVENLREQMILHQPVDAKVELTVSGLSLDTELARTPANEALSDFHVHHHYHAAPKTEAIKDKPLGSRRPKKRRNVTSPGLWSPSSGTQTPQIPDLRGISSSAATILSHTSVTIPPTSRPSHVSQWRAQPSQNLPTAVTPSLPSSPPSVYRDSSVFDSMDEALLSSRPTTPGSITFDSPDFQPRHIKRASDSSIQSLSGELSVSRNASGVAHSAYERMNGSDDTVLPFLDHTTILEEPEEDHSTRPSTMDADEPPDSVSDLQIRPMLHRASSHESLLSRRGVDVPQLRTKRSQLLGTSGSPRNSRGISGVSIAPITSSTSAVGRPLKGSKGYDPTNYNRLLLANASTNASTSPTSAAVQSDRSIFGKRMGGWITGKWGSTPAASAKVASQDPRAKAALTAIKTKSAGTKERTTLAKNRPADRSSTHIEATAVDSSLLQESLCDG